MADQQRDQSQRLLNDNDPDKNEGIEDNDDDNEEEGSEGDSDNNDDDDDELEDEDYDPDIKDDILRPASTRSKIVVNLREPDQKKKKQIGKHDKIHYDIDPYDKKLWKAFEKTIYDLQNFERYQPRKRQMPWYYNWPLILLEIIFLLILLYVLFLIVQLALFNLVIIGIIIVFFKSVFQVIEGFRWKCKFKYRTKDFSAFIEQQNETVYVPMGIEIQPEREGCWLEFLLREEEKMFEEEIALRREQIFKNKNTEAIEEMKKILNDYSKEKNKAEEVIGQANTSEDK